MPNPYFQFKQFTVMHDQCSMKVGTDGVLLGAWTQPPEYGDILDIGTGCGLIALMLAQKSKAGITGIDIDLQTVEQARENVALSPWKNRIKVEHASFQNFIVSNTNRYDLIVSNPPFFQNSLLTPEIRRTFARHQTELKLEELFKNVHHLLKESGKFCLVYPSEKEDELMLLASVNYLYPNRIMYVQPTLDLPPKRLLAEFTFTKKTPKVSHLAIEDGFRHNFTEEYKKLTRDYYLAF